jgi:hypothetical protein
MWPPGWQFGAASADYIDLRGSHYCGREWEGLGRFLRRVATFPYLEWLLTDYPGTGFDG